MNKLMILSSFQKGQSMIELLVAMGVFVILVSSIVFLIVDSYVAGRLAKEITQATFLAEEGLEAARSIRDNSWEALVVGSHGLAILGNNWIFQGTQEDISWQLREGTRKITIEDVALDRKMITSEVTWQFSQARPQEVELVTYLTNWQKVSILVGHCTGTSTFCDQFSEQNPCQNQEGCSWTEAHCGGTCTLCRDLDQTQCYQQDGCFWLRIFCRGRCTPCDDFLNQDSCQNQLGCSWNLGNCVGTPIFCDSYTTPEECLGQDGCYWEE